MCIFDSKNSEQSYGLIDDSILLFTTHSIVLILWKKVQFKQVNLA